MARINNAALRGKQNRAAGALFEQMIDAACRYYRQAGIAEIEKTPEAMKPLGHQNGKGQFLACYVKKAQPDFKGTLKGGCSIVFEAKITSADKIQQSVVLEQPADNNSSMNWTDCVVANGSPSFLNSNAFRKAGMIISIFFSTFTFRSGIVIIISVLSSYLL